MFDNLMLFCDLSKILNSIVDEKHLYSAQS